MLKIDYPSGFGPENNLPLDISNTFMIEVPAGYNVAFSDFISGHWDQAICGYSLYSGAKIFELKGQHPSGNAPHFANVSNTVYAYLLTGWYKDPAINQWKQTGALYTEYRGYTDINESYEIYVEFSGDKESRENINTRLIIRLNKLVA